MTESDIKWQKITENYSKLQKVTERRPKAEMPDMAMQHFVIDGLLMLWTNCTPGT